MHQYSTAVRLRSNNPVDFKPGTINCIDPHDFDIDSFLFHFVTKEGNPENRPGVFCEER
jgi:hypothetical protein